MRSLATPLIFFLIVACLYSCSSQRPVSYSKTHSYGFYHDDHIYFLLDYKVSKQGRRIWFIMPMNLPRKVYFREIYLYRYEPNINKLEKLNLLRKDFVPAVDVKYTKFTGDNSNIVFAYFAGYDDSYNRMVDLFIWDGKAGLIKDTGYENPVSEDNPLHQQYFGNYQSPWSDNPGIIGISRLRNEILQHLTNEDYDLPEDW